MSWIGRLLHRKDTIPSRETCFLRLAELGYDSVKDFQANNNIRPSGRLTRLTKHTLFSYYCARATK